MASPSPPSLATPSQKQATPPSKKGGSKIKVSMGTATRSSVNGGRASSRKSRAASAKTQDKVLKMRTVSQVQTFFKERTPSKADAYIRDRTASEGHAFLKSLAPDASFLQVFKREPPFVKEPDSSSECSIESVLEESVEGIGKQASEIAAGGVKMPTPPPEELDDVCAEWAKHPFVMPPDEKVFHIRALQKKKERDDFKKDCLRSVVDKSTFASRSGAIVGSDRLRKQLKDLDRAMENLLLELKQAPPMLQTCFYHREKENLQEFVAKKREIFFVQMSLDTKRAEIRKLEERIFQREEALRKSEEMLEEDSLEFDAFLKKNDEKMQEAIKRAEKNTKLKQDKVLEIKKLNNELAVVKAELSKYEEQLEECKKYREFLLSLTPLEWFEEQAILKTKRDEQRRALASEQGKEPRNLDTEEGEEEVTYFEHPKQLLEIFSDIEVANLALLQQSQDTEGILESLKTKLRETRAQNDAEIGSLRSQLSVLQAQAKLEDEKQATLKKKTNMNVQDMKHDISFEALCAKVLTTYLRCGMDADPSLGTLQMLTMIEAKMEDGLVALKSIPPEFSKVTEKSREKERRLRVREENLEALRREQEERRVRSLERARAPIFKRKGKPPMFRTYLRKKKKAQLSDGANANEDAELGEFLARDY